MLSACRGGDAPRATPAAITPQGEASRIAVVSPAVIPSLAPTQTPMKPAPTVESPTPVPTPTPRSLADAPVLSAGSVGQMDLLAQVDYGLWELVTALAWSPDGRWLGVGVGERIELLDFPGLQRRSSFRTGSLTHGLAFSPDSAWLAAAGRDGFFRVWRVEALAAAVDTAPALSVQAHRKGANAAVFSPQFSQAAGPGGWLAASGGNDAVARFWDISTGENTGLMIGGSFAVPSIAFLPDGELLAVINGDRIRLREVGSERIAGTFMSDAPLYSLAISPDGKLIAAGGSDNLIRLWLVEAAFRTGQEKYPDPQIFAGHTGRSGTFRSLVWQVVFSPAGDLLVSVGGDGALVVWMVSSGQELFLRLAHPGGATSVVFHPEGRLLATGGLDGSIKIWGLKGD